MSNSSVFGYYEVAGHQFHNKFKAFEFAVANRWYPHWNFLEDRFSKHDWRVEPIQDLDALYAARARQLREKYQHLVLWYSGGSDSHTVAESFVLNNVLLDEIWHRSSFENVSRIDTSLAEENQINETVFTTLPQAKKLAQLDPRIKFNFFDAMQYAIDFWTHNRLDLDQTNYFHPLAPAKMHSERFNTVSATSAAKITALDKPKIYLENNRWYFVFFDMVLHTQLMQNRSHQTDIEDDVCFFWEPDAVEILIKQAHMIKRWFEHHPQHLDLVKKNQTDTEKTLYENIIKPIIYPHWDVNTWQVKKTNNFIAHPEFYWFYQDQSSGAYQNWHACANAFSQEVDALAARVDPMLSSGFRKVGEFWNLPGCYSRPYFLGDYSPITVRAGIDSIAR